VSYENRYSGAITITPLLTAAEIRRAPGGVGASAAWDAHLRIDRRETETDAGTLVVYTADAIVGPEQACSGHEVEAQIRALVELFAGDHEFAGHIQVDWDPGFGEPPSRYLVRGRDVVTVKPRLAWPEGSE